MTNIKKTIKIETLTHEVLEADYFKDFFDTTYYLAGNADVQKAKKEPFDHYLTYGFNEQRNPSYLINFSYLRMLLKSSFEHVVVMPETFQAHEALLRTWPVDSVFGPSALVCPSWLMLQTQAPEGTSLAELLSMKVPAGHFSIHPCLRPYQVKKPMTVSDVIGAFSISDFEALSLVDLGDYVSNHRDLKMFEGDLERSFSHLWGYGLVENRLKYLGNRRPSNVSFEQVFITQCATIYRSFLADNSLVLSGNVHELRAQSIEVIKDKDPKYKALNDVLDLSHPRLITGLSVQSFNHLQDILIDMRPMILFAHADPDESVKTRRVGSRVVTDQDLISGVHKVTTRRVVYGVNIGAYDALPIPPEMEDCSYFLITDSAEIPVDSPWTVVSPTLREIDVKRQCLWYKTHPHWLFPDAEFVTWIDSNIECRTLAGHVLMSHEAMSEIATFAHPDRTCVYEEAKAIAKMKLDQSSVIDRVISQMKVAEFPLDFGLFETNVLFSRTRDMGVRAFFDTWWRDIYLGSRRDQMSFTFAAWKEKIEISKLDGRSCAKDSRFFYKRQHQSKKGRFV